MDQTLIRIYHPANSPATSLQISSANYPWTSFQLPDRHHTNVRQYTTAISALRRNVLQVHEVNPKSNPTPLCTYSKYTHVEIAFSQFAVIFRKQTAHILKCSAILIPRWAMKFMSFLFVVCTVVVGLSFSALEKFHKISRHNLHLKFPMAVPYSSK